MPPRGSVSSATSARIIHGALATGVLMFCLVAWFLGRSSALPVYALPDRRVLYIALFLVSAVLFGAAMFTADRLGRPSPGMSQDEWWRGNLGKAVAIWAMVEAPAILGLIAYTLTHDFRAL
nr:hypothetical protein [Gemmatimonadales bacterium]